MQLSSTIGLKWESRNVSMASTCVVTTSGDGIYPQTTVHRATYSKPMLTASRFSLVESKIRTQIIWQKVATAIYRMKRFRPQAVKGEKALTYLLLDAGGDLKTIDDQVITGTGPSSPDPSQLGLVHAYTNVERWRPIFDSDDTQIIAALWADCATWA